MGKINANSQANGPQVPFWMKEPSPELAKNLPGAHIAQRPALANAAKAPEAPRPAAQQSGGFIAFLKNLWHKITGGGAAKAPNPPAPRVPVQPAEESFNEKTLSGLMNSSSGYDETPDTVKDAIKGFMQDMADRYGLPALANAKFSAMFGIGHLVRDTLKPVLNAANAEHRDVTPEEVLAALSDLGKRGAVKLAIGEMLAKAAQDNGFKLVKAAPSDFMKSHPEIVAELENAPTPEAARAVFAKYAGDFTATALRGKALAKAEEGIANATIAKIVQGTGLDEQYVAKLFTSSKLMEKAMFLSKSIVAGSKDEYKAADFDIQKAFDELATKTADKYINAVAKLKTSNVSAYLKSKWTANIINCPTPDAIDVDGLLAITAKLDIARMEKIFAPGIKRTAVSNLMIEISQQINAEANELFGAEKWGDIGADGRETAIAFILDAAVEKSGLLYDNLTTPGPRNSLRKICNETFNIPQADRKKLPKQLLLQSAVALQMSEYLFSAFEKNKVWNKELANSIAKCTDVYEGLPQGYQEKISKVFGELQARYGAENLPGNPAEIFTPDKFAGGQTLRAITDKANAEFRRITPEEFEAGIRKDLELNAATHVLLAKMKDLAAANGQPEPVYGDAMRMLEYFDEMTGKIYTAEGPAQVKALIEENADALAEQMAVSNLVKGFAGKAVDETAEIIADKLGLDKAIVLHDFKFARRVNDKADTLFGDIAAGRHPGSRADNFDYKAPFTELAEKIAQSYIDAFAAIEKLDIPEHVKIEFRNQVATNDKPGIYNFAAIKATAAKTDLSNLANLLANGSDEDVLKEIVRVGHKLVPDLLAEVEALGTEKPEGSDEVNAILHLVVLLAADGKEGLAANFSRRFDDLFEKSFTVIGQNDIFGTNTFSVMGGAFNSNVAYANNMLKASISNPDTMPFGHQMEFLKMATSLADDMGISYDTPADLFTNQRLLSGKLVREELCAYIDAATREGRTVGAGDFAAAAKRLILEGVAWKRLDFKAAELAAISGTPSREDMMDSAKAAIERNRDRLVAAGSEFELQQILADIERDTAEIMKAVGAVIQVSTGAAAKVASIISERTGTPMTLLRSDIAVNTLTGAGGTLNGIAKEILRQASKPETDLATFVPAQIGARATAALEDFANAKATAINAIKAANLPDDIKLAWTARIISGYGYDNPAIFEAAAVVVSDPAIAQLAAHLAQMLSPANIANTDDAAVKNAIVALAAAIQNKAAESFPNANFGQDALRNIGALAATFAGAANPALLQGFVRLEEAGRARGFNFTNGLGDVARGFAGAARYDAKNHIANTLVAKHANAYSAEVRALFKDFLVKSDLSLAARDTVEGYLYRLMDEASLWTSFSYDSHKVDDVTDILKERMKGRVQDLLAGELDNTQSGKTDELGISAQFVRDAPRANYTINGQTFPQGGLAQDVVNALIKAVPTPEARKVVSCIANQFAFNDQLYISNNTPLPKESTHLPESNAANETLGSGAMLKRPQVPPFQMPFTGMGQSSFYNIQVEGNTVTIEMECDFKLNIGILDEPYQPNDIMGHATLKQKVVLDISGPVPQVTDLRLGQDIKAA